MVTSDNLNLHALGLKAGGQWKVQEEGFAFILPTAGAGNFVSGSFARSLSPGDVLLLNMAGSNAIHVPPKDPFSFYFFTLRLEPLYSLFSSQEACQLRHFMECLKTARFYSASESIAAESHKLIATVPKEFNFHHRSQLLRIAAGIISMELNQAFCHRNGASRSDTQNAGKFDKLSAEQIMNLSAGELAAKFRCSRRHLSRLFHQQFGMSVASLRMEMRLLRAASLLRDPHSKIASVADECGFNHLGMFNSLFKKRFGARPSHWRNSAPPPESPKEDLHDTKPLCPLMVKGLCPWSEKAPQAHSLTLMQSAA
jgi:AraC-like DNA-binding protein